MSARDRNVSDPLVSRRLSVTGGVPTAGEVAQDQASQDQTGQDQAGQDQTQQAESTPPPESEKTQKVHTLTSSPNSPTPPNSSTAPTGSTAPTSPTPPNSPTPPTGSTASAGKPRPSARQVAHQANAVLNAVRSKLGPLVWCIALICAVVLALGAILAVLNANTDNGLVSFVNDFARKIDGPFADMFTFAGKNADKKEILVNWGIGAIVYLIVGRILDRIIRP